MSTENIKEAVQEKYGEIARAVAASGSKACCGTSASTCETAADPITSNLYAEGERAALPVEAVKASLGCGNPTALAQLRPRSGLRRRH